MIKSRQDIQYILEDYYDTCVDFLQSLTFEKNGWDSKKQCMYSEGIVFGKIQEKDKNTIDILCKTVSDDCLKCEIEKYYIKIIKVKNNINSNSDYLQRSNMQRYEVELRELHSLPLEEWINIYCGWMKKYISNDYNFCIETLVYIYYSFKNFYKEMIHPLNDDMSRIEQVYDLDFRKKSQFSKYRLMPINTTRSIIINNPPALYDEIKNKTFFIKNIPSELLITFKSMMKEYYIKDLSVRLFNNYGFDGKIDINIIQESIEFGKKFDLSNLEECSVTKLYGIEDKNCLWVNIDKENITFEEIYDSPYDYNNQFITQVIHLQYKKIDNEYYITHLDHEYIFYLLDEYVERTKNIKQKGTASKRVKSFKIDNSKIPFDYKCRIQKNENSMLSEKREQFLYFILDLYFINKENLLEYFSNL